MLRTHGTMVDVSAPFVMPMCDSDILMNVPFTSRNKQPFPHAKEANEKIRSLERASACKRTRLGVQCMNALILCVWPDHACLSLGQEACSVHKQGVMLRTPGSPWSSRRRPGTLVERPAAVREVAQPDR